MWLVVCAAYSPSPPIPLPPLSSLIYEIRKRALLYVQIILRISFLFLFPLFVFPGQPQHIPKHVRSLGVMHDLSDEYARALIIGHNPGLEELVEMLTGEIHLMPTCSLAHVKIRVDKWSDIDNKIKGKVAGIWRPRDLT